MQAEDEGGSLVGVLKLLIVSVAKRLGFLRCDENGFGVYSYFVKGHVKDMRQGSMETISHVVGRSPPLLAPLLSQMLMPISASGMLA